MAEKHIERSVRNQALWDYGVPSLKLNVTGSTGWPDTIFFIAGGKPFLIEFKVPGETPDPKQLYIHKILRTRGYNVQVHTNKEAALKAIKAQVDAAAVHEKSNEILNRAVKCCAILRPRTKKN